MRLIFQTLDINTSLKSFSLVRFNLKDDDVEDLFDSLKRNTDIEKLELDDNRLSEYSVKLLAEGLNENTSIRHLSLQGNFLSKESIITLADVLGDKVNITYVNLSNTGLANEALDALIDAASRNQSLVMIDIEGNDNLNYKRVRRLQSILEKNRKNKSEEKRSEWNNRRMLTERDATLRLVNEKRAQRLVKLGEMKEKAKEAQAWRQKLIGEQIEKKKVQDFRLAKQLEKEMMIRAMKKRRNKEAEEKPV